MFDHLDIDPTDVMHKLKGVLLTEIALVCVFVLLAIMTHPKVSKC